MSNSSSRRLAAILSADLVGYSRLMETDESGTIAALRAVRVQVFDPMISEYGGRIVSTAGDSLLVEYPSAVEAVRSAIEVQREISERGKATPDDRRIVFRIGINIGDVVIDGDDLLGDGVNIAARLQALCSPGAICISASVREQTTGKVEVELKDLGKVRLKNISRDVRAYEIAGHCGDGPDQRPQLAGSDATASPIDFTRFDRASIVILPFRDLGGADQDCLGEGLRLSLHSVLIKLSGLFLLHTAAVEKFRGQDLSPVDIGREIEVRYIVSGAVQRAGDRIRILVELTDVAAGQIIWADRLDRTIMDIFSFQDEVTQQIVGDIGFELRGGEELRTFFTTASSVETLACLHRAISHLYRGTREDTAIARDWGEKLLELEPDNPSFMGIIALTHWRDSKFGWSDDPQASLDRAADLAQRCIDAGDPEGTGSTIIAYARLHERRFDEALAASMKARSHRPSCPLSNGVLADVMRYSGAPEQAVDQMRNALRLSRTFPPWMLSAFAASLRDNGEIEASIEAASQAAQLFPDDVESKVTLCCDHILAGSAHAAEEVAAQIRRVDPAFSISAYVSGQPYKDSATLDSISESLRRVRLPE